MSELQQLYARLAPAVSDLAALEAAVLRVADHLDERLETVVDAIVQACRLEIPEYEALPPERAALQRQRNLMGIALVTSMIRVGRTSFDPVERVAMLGLGRELAGEPEPLHAVIRTFQIAARELITEAINVVGELGPLAAPALSVVLKIGFGLLAQYIELMAEGFVEAERESGLRWSDPGESLVSDLVLGVVPETFEARARHVGLAERSWYRAVVRLHDKDSHEQGRVAVSDDALVRRLPAACLFGRVGRLAIVICGCDDDGIDPTPRVAELLAGGNSPEGRVPVAIGPAREHLTGIRESFETAVSVLEAGHSTGTGGVLAASVTVVPRLVTAARAAGLDVTGVLDPLFEGDARAAPELLGAIDAYIRNGCSVQRAADESHMHRNTMRRRLQRAEELLGFSVAERWVEIELALIALAAPVPGVARD